MNKRVSHVLCCVVLIASAILICVRYLYTRPNNSIEYDGSYYWNETDTEFGVWRYAKSPTGWEYYLYLPPDVMIDDELAKVPLIVTFHGQSGKYATLSQQGRVFMNEDFQWKSGGCAVLVMMSRIDHFTDPHSCARLIKNLSFKYPCLDMSNIAGYGFSQGAAYVVELAIEDPSLFRAVIAGSGYHIITARELLRVLPVKFCTAVSENDAGIFEPGSRTGSLLARYCRGSRYIQYTNRGHFWLELTDKTGIDDETVESWLINILRER